METALIDTSIIIEPFTEYRKGKKNYKEAAFTLLRYSKRHFIPAVSLSVLGELEFIINSKESLKKEIENKRDAMREILDKFLKECKIIGLNKETLHLVHTILNEDYSLDPSDVLHFSSAIMHGCNSFIFMDEKIEKSEVINRIAKENNLKLENFNIPRNEDRGKPRGESIWN